MVEQSAHNPNFTGPSPAVGNGREIIVKKGLRGLGSGSSVVIQSTLDPKFKGLYPDVTGIGIEIIVKKGLPGQAVVTQWLYNQLMIQN